VAAWFGGHDQAGHGYKQNGNSGQKDVFVRPAFYGQYRFRWYRKYGRAEYSEYRYSEHGQHRGKWNWQYRSIGDRQYRWKCHGKHLETGIQGVYSPAEELVMGKCPFTGLKKKCDPECELYKEVIRVYEDGKQEIVKGCVFVLDHEERRNQTQRIAMMQAEVGETKNATLFGALAGLGESKAADQIIKMAIKADPLALKESDNE
jgi:hypothetical protein